MRKACKTVIERKRLLRCINHERTLQAGREKTIGFEIAEQLNWKLPDVIIYPTGGGTGLIGMWKAFAEMQQMSWITGKLPRMVIVQSENCAPMMQMFEHGKIDNNFSPLPSLAYGLAVPFPLQKI